MKRNHYHPDNLCIPFTGTVISEKLLQFIWQMQYFNQSELRAIEGDSIEILAPGIHNKDQGPDFLDARIQIGSTLLAGSIELHLHTSEWEAHRHDGDENYRNVILHVVFRHDRDAGSHIPVLELEPRISGLMLEKYHVMMQSAAFISCGTAITQVNPLIWTAWKESLIAMRFDRKATGILADLQQSRNHWEEVFWWRLARYFGTRVNTDAFEAMARSLPVAVLSRHRNQVHQMEALLFGQAGLLRHEFSESYPVMLKKEYGFLCKKYGLRPIDMPVHFLRMRPGNFPTIRLAQLAVLLQGSERLLPVILEADNMNELRGMLSVTANDYWHYHYRFDQPSAYKVKQVGSEMVNGLLLNVILPVQFAYGKYHQRDDLKERAHRWLMELPAEDNAITTGFRSLKVQGRSAWDSQALVELKSRFCMHRRCLECAVGNSILKGLSDAAAFFVTAAGGLLGS
ncbi:MAG TPA: DUF2851 family protein, partial [Flavisolibacter sp.]